MRYLGKRWRGLYTSPFSCVHLIDIPELQLPTPEWVKVKTQTQRHLWLRFSDDYGKGKSLFLAVHINAFCVRT